VSWGFGEPGISDSGKNRRYVMTKVEEEMPRKKTWLWMVPLLAIAGVVIFQMRRQIVPTLNALETLVGQAGYFGPVLLVLVMGLWLTLLLPAPLILGLAGTVYAHSPFLAVLVSSMGVALAQCSAFILARFYFRQAVLNKLGHQLWFRKLDEQVEEKGAKGVVLIRVLPVFPNTLCNYAFGLTKISFGPYILASWAGSLPLVTVLVLGTSGFIQFMEGQ
jgi:uncharacterized membrane protein YdjX (TVP38/TMEM64 family)